MDIANSFSSLDGKAMEKSFQEFLQHPMNQPLVDNAQRLELRQLLAHQEQQQVKKLLDDIKQLDSKTQAKLAPLCSNSTVVRILCSFSHSGQLAEWCSNPEAFSMLSRMHELVQRGALTATQLEQMLLQVLKDPKSSAHKEFESVSTRTIKLPAEQLVAALNEHLQERRKAQTAHVKGDLETAVTAYRRALSITEVVEGCSEADQREVIRNRQAALLGLAAALNDMQQWRKAMAACNQILVMNPHHGEALKQRAKSFLGLLEVEDAEKDLKLILQHEPNRPEVLELLDQCALMKEKFKSNEKRLYSKMMWFALPTARSN